MSLGWKLVISYLIVIAVGLLVLALSTAFLAPVDFSRHMANMQGMLHVGSGGMMGADRTAFEAELDGGFRDALNRALLMAGVAASLVAAGLSWYISRRIVQPIHVLVEASQFIAEGHYSERLEAQADDELGELTRSFNRMAAALAETESRRQRLIADVSHELKTPLASIKGYMEGLQDGVIAPTPETFELVHREADRLQRLVSDLQELSRAEAAQLPMDIRPCQATDVVKLAIAALRPQFDDKGVILRAELPGEPLEVRADVDRARQVLLNLLGNALQYTLPGGCVTVRLVRDGTSLRFSVEDTGIGLSAADRERVFERFYRVDKSRARASGGSGIGLTIARHIVEAHGGKIWAESAGSGHGSTFHFTLPLA
jgi:signal transduction histidine kinase